MKAILEWAKAEGREKDVSPELLAVAGTQGLSDAEIEAKITEMEAARRTRNFQISDAVRAELTSAGLLVEITKDGVRWRRK
jgi:cysteinyl-tRNA synthetase